MYNNLLSLINQESEERKRIKRGYINESDSTLKHFLTPARLAKYQAGEMDRETALTLAINKAYKEVEKETARDVERLENVSQAAGVVSIDISVEWTRSRVWGMNPTASVTIVTKDDNGTHYSRFYGHASGCGYDKLSAAVANALNDSNAAKKLLYDCKEKALETIEPDVRINAGNAQYIAYGAGYGALPYYEGGVGMSSLQKVLEVCGLVLEHQSEGKTYNNFYFVKA